MLRRLWIIAAVVVWTSFPVPCTARLTRKERLESRRKEEEAYHELKARGVDEVGHSHESAALRHYQLRKKKRKGLLRKKEASLADGALSRCYSGSLYGK